MCHYDCEITQVIIHHFYHLGASSTAIVLLFPCHVHMPCEPQIIKYCHPHLETASLFPNVRPGVKSQTLATRTPETPKSLPAGLQPCISL